MFRVVLHVLEHVGHGFAVNGLVDTVVFAVNGDVYGVRIAKEVVHIAQNFLIGAHEKYADIIVLAVLDGMERQIGRLLVVIDVGANLSIGVARDVLKRGRAGWFLR